MNFQYNDGGRAAAGFKGEAGDCVCRAIAIATGLPYGKVYGELAFRVGGTTGVRSARNGVKRDVYERYLKQLGWKWVPTMAVGKGCTVHLSADELPTGCTIIARVSKHLCAVVDGVLHDTHDCSREGSRCVYGYFIKGN